MLSLFRKRPPLAPVQPRANPTRIAVLEHELLGIPPEPGTAAAVTVALRRAGTCLNHDPVDVTCVDDPGPNAMCAGCGAAMVLGAQGSWVVAGSR
jgi:hypothetical protein